MTWTVPTPSPADGPMTGDDRPTFVTINTPSGPTKLPLDVGTMEDHGDLRRRWAEGRLAQMMAENTGRAAMRVICRNVS